MVLVGAWSFQTWRVYKELWIMLWLKTATDTRVSLNLASDRRVLGEVDAGLDVAVVRGSVASSSLDLTTDTRSSLSSASDKRLLEGIDAGLDVMVAAGFVAPIRTMRGLSTR